jgi:hypothetical protein
MGKTLIAAVAGMALATFLVWPGRREARVQPSQASVEPATFAPASRLVYPFSVIPGGVRSAAELRAALRADPVAARHYAGFDLRHVEVVRLEEAHAAYVSYRRHNRVLWTSKKVMLAKGEQLLSDGMNLARTRCGNRISFTPIPDLTSVTEPDETVWDTPEIPPVYSSVDVTEKLVQVPMTGSAARRKPTGVLPKDTDFPIPIVFLGGAKAVNTPEPGTWLMLLTGLVVFLIMKLVVKVPGWRNRQTQRT